MLVLGLNSIAEQYTCNGASSMIELWLKRNLFASYSIRCKGGEASLACFCLHFAVILENRGRRLVASLLFDLSIQASHSVDEDYLHLTSLLEA
jgi:hypothetical protein